MISDKEKRRIVESIKFENQIRNSLDLENQKLNVGIWNKLNSNFSLLIIGAILTGLLVPVFQTHQKTLEWKRQNKYDTVKYNLEMMRNCQKEFVFLTAYTSEAYERARPFIEADEITKIEYSEFTKQFIEMQNIRLRHVAKVKSLVIYFVNSNSILRAIEKYIINSTNYIRDVEYCVYQRFCLLRPQECSMEILKINKDEFEKNIAQIQNIVTLNEDFERVISEIQDEIIKVEQDNETFSF